MFVALKRQRFGDRHLYPGDEVPDEPGRNYNLMLRQGLIADVDVLAESEEALRDALKGAKVRIENLEGLLAEARAELKGARAGDGSESTGEEEEPAAGGEEPSAGGDAAEGKGEEPAPSASDLDELTKSELLERADAAGLDLTMRSTKAEIIDAITKAAEGKGEE